MTRLKKVIFEAPCKLMDQYWAIAYGNHGMPLQVVHVVVNQIDVHPEYGATIWVRRIDERTQDYWRLSVEDFIKWACFKTREEAVKVLSEIKE